MLADIRNRIKRRTQVNAFKRANPGVRVDGSLQLRLPQYIRCGEKVVIGENSRLLCWDSYKGTGFDDPPQITIGSGVHATRNLTIQCANKVTIGENVLIASDVFIVDYNHGMSPLTANYLDNPLDISEGITIEEGVWIGNNVIILPHVTIGKKSVIGAGSVVTKSIPPYTVAAGNPAKVIKRFDFDRNEWVGVRNE